MNDSIAAYSWTFWSSDADSERISPTGVDFGAKSRSVTGQPGLASGFLAWQKGGSPGTALAKPAIFYETSTSARIAGPAPPPGNGGVE